MDELYETCGYVATFLGTLLEGEISLTTSMLGAKMGHYNVWGAMIAAFAGAWVADWFKYLIGKTKGATLLDRKPKIKSKVDRATIWFERHPYLILTFYKFLFETTTVILLLAGIKKVSYLRFAIHTGLSVALWVAALGGLAYHCSELLLQNFEFISKHKYEIIALLSLLAAGYWFFIKRPKEKYCTESIA